MIALLLLCINQISFLKFRPLKYQQILFDWNVTNAINCLFKISISNTFIIKGLFCRPTLQKLYLIFKLLVHGLLIFVFHHFYLLFKVENSKRKYKKSIVKKSTDLQIFRLIIPSFAMFCLVIFVPTRWLTRWLFVYNHLCSILKDDFFSLKMLPLFFNKGLIKVNIIIKNSSSILNKK